MNRTDTFILELNKPETRLLFDIIREWMGANENEHDVLWSMAEDISETLYGELKGGRNVLQ